MHLHTMSAILARSYLKSGGSEDSHVARRERRPHAALFQVLDVVPAEVLQAIGFAMQGIRRLLNSFVVTDGKYTSCGQVHQCSPATDQLIWNLRARGSTAEASEQRTDPMGIPPSLIDLSACSCALTQSAPGLLATAPLSVSQLHELAIALGRDSTSLTAHHARNQRILDVKRKCTSLLFMSSRLSYLGMT